MCGISGVWNFATGEPVDREVLVKMNNALGLRGPDDEGYYVDGPVGLGHRRLSIIDLETGKQPIHNEDETVWIVFNGEIYNCRELGRELEQSGHRFTTTSDTEVIVHAYEQFGRECVNRLNGMFAFAIWDERQRRLFLARDRAGIKPFYYAVVNGRFLFGSELKAILEHPLVERRIDLVALNQYLAFEYVPTPRTIFEGISKLPPGATLTVENGTVREEQYWDMRLAESEDGNALSEETYLAQLKSTLRDVVRKELIADVPVGVLLSGGIDSSAIAAMMAELVPGKVKSFSIAFEDKSFDESSYARTVARHLGTEHQEMTLTAARMLELIPRIAEFLDEPLGDSSIVPTYLLSEFTRRTVKVALGGDGGDELFGGYSTLQAHRIADYCNRFLPDAVSTRLLPWMVDRLPVSFDNISWDFKARRFVAGLGLPPVVRHHLWLGSLTADQRSRLLGVLAQGHGSDVEDVARGYATASRAREPMNQVLYCDMKLYLEGDILAKVDRASMANSLEVRVPLLNQTMIEFAQRVPHRLKLKGLTTKYLLRHAVKDLLPAAIVWRCKKGFNMPVAKWLEGPLLELAKDMFSAERLKRQGLFDPAFVQHLLDEHLQHRRDNRKHLWTLLVFELWYERWMERG
jgi:asparagine synthase (glutamine-hydrolysing)